MRRSASSLFRHYFSKSSLRDIFEEKVSHKSSIGTDGVRIEKFRNRVEFEIDDIKRKCENGEYKFVRYKPKLISKGYSSPPRIISVPNIRDRIVLRALMALLSDLFVESHTRKPHTIIKELYEHIEGCSSEFSIKIAGTRDLIVESLRPSSRT